MTPALEIRDLRLVQAIADAGGATAAARLLHLSQSAISHQLRGLEQRLGVSMFERRGRGLHITPAGQRVLRLAQELIAPLMRTELELKRARIEPRPRLRLGAQCYTAYHWLPSAVAALLCRHPELDLVILNEPVQDLATAFAEDKLDLCLAVDAFSARAFERVKLFDDELVLALAPGAPLAKRKFVLGRELCHETLIQGVVSQGERDRVVKRLFPQGGGFARLIRVPVSEAILELVQAGLGVSILPGFALQSRLRRGEIASVRLTQKGLHRSWSGVFRRRSPLEPAIRTLLDVVRQPG